MKSLYILLLSGACITVVSCSKKMDVASSSETNFLTYSIEGQNTRASISSNLHTINIVFPDSVKSATNLVADFTLSSGCKASINNTEQISGVSRNDYNSLITYSVSSVSNYNSSWTISSTNNLYSQSWGLGNFIEEKQSNDRAYSWYLDQLNTGFDSIDNCGPTAVTMVCKWADSTFTKTPQDARMKYETSGGWWFTPDIDNYLSDNGIAHDIISLPQTATGSMQLLKKQIDLNELVILCIDMNYIRLSNNQNFRTDKFYSTTPGFGHFFIIKGYAEVDNEMYFQVYDPNSWGQKNPDGSLKGKDRFYRHEDIFDASNNWWPYAFVIAKNGSILSNISSTPHKNIPVKYGR
jgi:hypothetical protein